MNFWVNKKIKKGEELDPKLNPTKKNCFDYFLFDLFFHFLILIIKGAEDKREIQSALQATITKTISEGSIEPGNVTIFNLMPCIQLPSR